MKTPHIAVLLVLLLNGCASFKEWLPTSGPSRKDIVGEEVVNKQPSDPNAPTVQLIEVNETTLRLVNNAQKRSQFSTLFKPADTNRNLVGAGDVLDVNIWEASPALLFGATAMTVLPTAGGSSAKASTFPDQVVNVDGTISIPFAGTIKASGKSTQAIAQDITAALKNKANMPQVMVRTTRNTTSWGMWALMQNPDQYAALAGDMDGKIDNAIEEILRWATPVYHFRRTATDDTVIGDKEIKKGDKVVMWHISADRDEEVFDDPYQFNIERFPNEHIAFGGGGQHFCLGANLARMELKLIFKEILERIPDMSLAGNVDILRSNFIGGIKHMPVNFTAGARRNPAPLATA
jgi:hypothetical protein